MLIIINRHVHEIQVQRNRDGNDFKMVEKETLKKLSKKFTVNMWIMDKAGISGRETIELFKGGTRRI